MPTTSWLPHALRWMFWVFTILIGILVFVVAVVFVFTPSLPSHGPVDINIVGHSWLLWYQNPDLASQIDQKGVVSMRIMDSHAFDLVFVHTLVPITLVFLLYFGLLFEVLRRLFRNVENGLSFTPQSLRLLRYIGLSLLVYSLVCSLADGWLEIVIFDYATRHGVSAAPFLPIQLSSGEWIRLPNLPATRHYNLGDDSYFDGTFFFAGLLVLALSEVFRQGLRLKSDNELTI